MEKAILGKKIGMSQIFAPDGKVIPVTVVEAGPCTVVQIKTVAKDGYDAIKLGFSEIKEKEAIKPVKGLYKNLGIAPKKYHKEFRTSNVADYTVGQEFKCDVFEVSDFVDVAGTTKGHGFTGAIKRWNTHRIPMTHGAGPVHREVGSLNANSSPSRVFKNKKMAGQYGCERATVQNLEIVRVDVARNLLLIAGGVPGAKGALLEIKKSNRKNKGTKWFKVAEAPKTAKK